MSAPQRLTGVGSTALGVADVRARESARPDRLFDDPYAAAFVAAAPDVLPRTADGPDGVSSVRAAFAAHTVFRTRYYDDHLLSACAAGIRQVVLLASGLDTRAFRLPWPDGVRLFEIDLPDVLAFKHGVLDGMDARPKCARTAVAEDLRADWPATLTAAAFDPAVPTAWLAEGLLIYLTDDEARRLLTDVDTLSTPDSRIAFEYSANATSDLLDRARDLPTMARYGALWRGGLADDEAEWLRDHGWRASVHPLAELAADYSRPLRGTSVSGLLSAVREAGR